MEPETALETADALARVGLSRRVWNDTLGRGHFAEAPATSQGVPRRFYRDDLVALTILKVLLDLRMEASFAGSIASQVRAKLRESEAIEALYLALENKGGRPRPKIVETVPDDGKPPFVFRVAAYRKQAEADIAGVISSKGAS